MVFLTFQLITWLVFVNIDNDTDSEENNELRDTPHDDILDSELVVEDALLNEISIENFLSGNHSDSIQMSKEDINEFLTTSRDVCIDVNLFDELDDPEEIDDGIIFSINAGEVATQVNDQLFHPTSKQISVSGHVLMNQCGSLLICKNHEIKGLSKHKCILQRMCATSIGKLVPLRFLEAMIFPSIC